jgi:hypothetical protein
VEIRRMMIWEHLTKKIVRPCPSQW